MKIRVKAVKPKMYGLLDCNSGLQLYISRIKRYYKYKEGLDIRVRELSDKYFFDLVSFRDCDLFCDVGANIGEVTKIAQTLNAQMQFITVEPDPIEISALQMNLDGIRNYAVFLDSDVQTKEVKWSNQSGDTRLKFPGENRKRTGITNLNLHNLKMSSETITSTLDTLLLDYPFKEGFLKLEAEGFEPEVLMGAKRVLRRFRYISIDVGEERLLEGNLVSSFQDCYDFLSKHDFTFLYKRFNSCLFRRSI